MRDAVMMLFSLGLILASAEAFTNGVEWLGKRLNLGAGAVGSILAAVGTALPETMVPLVAFLGTQGEGAITEVGVGAILGAPFMLATLAFFISGLAALIWRRSNRPLCLQNHAIRRDLTFFIVTYTLAMGTSFLPFTKVKLGMAGILVSIYLIYVILTLRRSKEDEAEHGTLPPLYLARQAKQPDLLPILGQIALALTGIIVGAHGFVDGVQAVALVTGIPALALSLIITPIATELPEKFNSVLWIRRQKDTLAIGNITGAMVFQSSVIPALGIVLTPWILEPLALWSGLLALAAGLVPLISLRSRGTLYPTTLLAGGIFYLVFILTVLRFLRIF